MRVIVAGSRWCEDEGLVRKAIEESRFEVTAIVSGCCRGVDNLGEKIAIENGWPVHRFPADWKKYGRAAGPIRNRVMADNADALVAVLFPKSRGTASMIAIARRVGLPVFVKKIEEEML